MYMKDKLMCTISATEFRNNYKKYAEIAEKEEICVTRRDEPIFVIIPFKKAMEAKAKSFFNLLPAEARIGTDPDERSR